MFEINDNPSPRVTIIDKDGNAYEISEFYAQRNYSKDQRIGVHNDEFPEELNDISENTMRDWQIVVTEYTGVANCETRTSWGIIDDSIQKADGWIIDYV